LYKLAKANIDTSRYKHRRDDDEKVLHNKVDDTIWIFIRRKRAEDIADDFHETGQRYRQEVPRTIAEQLDRVDDEGKGEEDDAEDAE
jgi:hypothetical protein